MWNVRTQKTRKENLDVLAVCTFYCLKTFFIRRFQCSPLWTEKDQPAISMEKQPNYLKSQVPSSPKELSIPQLPQNWTESSQYQLTLAILLCSGIFMKWNTKGWSNGTVTSVNLSASLISIFKAGRDHVLCRKGSGATACERGYNLSSTGYFYVLLVSVLLFILLFLPHVCFEMGGAFKFSLFDLLLCFKICCSSDTDSKVSFTVRVNILIRCWKTIYCWHKYTVAAKM